MSVGRTNDVGGERALVAPAHEQISEAFPRMRRESEALSAPVLRLAGLPDTQDSKRSLGGVWQTIGGWTLSWRIMSSPARIGAAAVWDWERGAGFLLVPACFAAGALIYFSIQAEPALHELLASLTILGGALFLARERIVLRSIVLGMMLVTCGIVAAKFETWRADTKVLGGDISTVLTGRVVQIEHRATGRVRLTVDVVSTERPSLRYSPDRVRVTARSIPETIRTGAGVTGVVRLRQPSGPVRPGSYDFSFNSYFDGIGANGFFLTAPQPVELAAPVPWIARARTWLEELRHGLADRIRRSISDTEGEIAAALIAGVSAGIPEEANEAMRISGIYHVISISGLHLALVAGSVMVSMRAAFALFPAFASRHPVKKYAAAIALLVVFFYLFLAGAEVATQRSFIMLAVMLLALLFDRAALTMRNLAIAAVIVIAISPHEVAGPSFQMSFAATAALIAAYAAWSEWRSRRLSTSRGTERSLPVRAACFVLLYGGGIAMTSLVAGAATALFGAWHFNRIAPLGLVANLAAMPVVSLLVMPWALAGVALMPLGLDWLPLAVMEKGITVMLAIAEWVADRSPLDDVGIVPVGAVLLFSAVLLLLTVSGSLLRAFAIPLLVAGAVIAANRHPPDLMVAEDARLIAMPTEDGRVAVNRARPNGFTIENWARALLATEIGTPRRLAITPAAAASHPAGDFSCYDDLCLARHTSGAIVAHAASAEAARPVCGISALIVIDDATAGNICVGKSKVITKRDLARRGSAEIRFLEGENGMRVDIAYAIHEPFRAWHSHRAFSREARGLPPYRRPEFKTSTAGQASPVASRTTATATELEVRVQSEPRPDEDALNSAE